MRMYRLAGVGVALLLALGTSSVALGYWGHGTDGATGTTTARHRRQKSNRRG